MTVGKYVESIKQPNAYVVCGSIQSVALNLERFKEDDFAYIIIDEAHRGYTLDKELSEAELLFRDQNDFISKYSVLAKNKKLSNFIFHNVISYEMKAEKRAN